jgi:hypothetical protein
MRLQAKGCMGYKENTTMIRQQHWSWLLVLAAVLG